MCASIISLLSIATAFMQLNHVKRWRRTIGQYAKPGSRILFLDGGGIRGLIQIEILMEIERRTGRKITELFDWIVGTSTGGIVALGLVYGKGRGQERERIVIYNSTPMFAVCLYVIVIIV